VFTMVRRPAGRRVAAIAAAGGVMLLVTGVSTAGAAASRPAPARAAAAARAAALARAAAAVAAPCAPSQLAAAGVPPIGAPVQTVDQHSGAVVINGIPYVPSGPGSLAHLVIIDRCTLSVRAFGFGDHDEGLHQIRAELGKLDPAALLRYLVILAAPDGLGQRVGDGARRPTRRCLRPRRPSRLRRLVRPRRRKPLPRRPPPRRPGSPNPLP